MKHTETPATGDICFFTARESEIIAHLKEGLASKEIAKKLAISTLTVSRHRQNMMRKTGAKNCTELVCKIKEFSLYGCAKK
jgi:DNA-binding NarL/FixJ family response regulator